MPAHRYMEENGLAAMLTTKRSVGVAPEVMLKECVTHMPPWSMNKAAHSGFETQRRHYRKSKTGVLVAPQKRTYVLQFFLKKPGLNLILDTIQINLITTVHFILLKNYKKNTEIE